MIGQKLNLTPTFRVDFLHDLHEYPKIFPNSKSTIDTVINGCIYIDEFKILTDFINLRISFKSQRFPEPYFL